ncbi:MAG: hypothetical protein DWQ02_26700, partial [Bacteroidetes bacterium]
MKKLFFISITSLFVLCISNCELNQRNDEHHKYDIEGATKVEALPEGELSFSLDDLAVKNDILFFRNFNIMEEAIRSLRNRTDEEIDEWEKEIGFLSMRREINVQQQNPDIDDIELDSKRIPDTGFETILTPKGFYQVADTIYQVMDDKLIRFNLEGEKLGEQNFHRGTSNWCYRFSSCSRLLENGTRKIVGRKWVQNYGHYGSIGASSKHYKKNNKGKFKKAKVPFIHLYLDQWHEVCYEYKIHAAGVIICKSDVHVFKTSDNKVSHIFDSWV